MKTIQEYIDNNFIQNTFIQEEINVIVENMMINESFKSSLLQKLAKKIYDVEDYTRQRDKERQEQWEKDGYSGKRRPDAQSFSSIFGPITSFERFGKTTKKIQGVKWDEINDNDFVKFMGYEAKCKKAIKPIFAKGGQGLVIAVNPDNQDIVYFLKGYGTGKDFTPVTYTFNDTKDPEKQFRRGVKKITRTKYSYQERNLKLDEFMETVNDYEVYVLPITDSMLKTYKDLINDREELQKGVINYDKASLNRLLEQQKARYQALIKEMKAKKLMNDTDKLFDEIKKVNDEVIALYQKVTSNPKYLDQYIDMGRLMQYVSYAYEEYYKFAKSDHESIKRYQDAKARGFDNERAKRYSEYSKGEAKEHINDVQNYIKKVREMIKDIETNL